MSLGQATVPLRLARSSLLAWLSVFAVLAVAIAQHAGATLNPDNSWLLTIGEKWLSGQVPYVDFVEVNPPASILLYMPAVALAHWLDIRPEILVTFMMFAGIFAGLVLTGRILRSADLLDAAHLPWLLAAALFVFAVLPGNTFAQREHIAAVLVLPVLGLYAARIAGRSPSLCQHVLAGLAGGVCVVIKPYFAFSLLFPLAFAVCSTPGGWRSRLATLFALSNWIIAGLTLGYGLLVVLAFPAFVHDTMPLLLDMYVPVGRPLSGIGIGVGFRLAVPVLILCLLDLKRTREPATALLFLAAAGFAAATVIQGKGWPYHYFPIMALTFLALYRAVIERLARHPHCTGIGLPFIVGVVAAGLMTIMAGTFLSARSYSGILIDEVRAIAPPRPKILTISADIALGHPLTRELDGRWVDRLCAHWITANGDDMLRAEPDMAIERRAAIEKWMAFDKTSLVDDILAGKPDIILVEEGWWQRWSKEQAEVDAALSAYSQVKSVGGIAILLRHGPA